MIRRLLVASVAAAAGGCSRLPPEVAYPGHRPAPPAADRPPAAKVKLAVLVVFDQLRADYLTRWADQFGPDGFRRLAADGAWFTECRFPYATTATGPGHASVLAGCSPDRHGVINNEWYDRSAGAKVYCATSPRYRNVPPAAGAGAAPDRLLAPTVGDVLKARTGGRGKVVGLSLKDRGAVLPCGRTADAVYWFDGRLTTSTYYTDAPAGWAAAFDRAGLADAFFGRPWDRLKPAAVYDRLAGPDDGPGEGTGHAQGVAFPHPTTGGLTRPGPKYHKAVETSPFGNDLLLAAAKAAVVGERLGDDHVPDLLVVSFSANDYVGHAWGPDSHEVMDVTLRSDRTVADLLQFLDGQVGRGEYAVVLTSDHGVCPNPEVSAARGIPAARVPPAPLLAGLSAHLSATFPAAGPAANWLEAAAPPHLYLNRAVLADRGLSPAAVAAVAAEYLGRQPGLAAAFTREQLSSPSPPGHPLLPSARRAYHPDRGGDVFAVLAPYHLLGDPAYPTGTSHGTPHEYDVHVPLLVYGPGVAGGRRTEPTTPLQAAAVAARFLGVPRPDLCEYDVPATLDRP